MDELNQGNLTPKEQYDQKKKERGQVKNKEQAKEKINAAPKKIGKIIFYALITIVVIGGLGLLASFIPNLPPTSQANHSENSPAAHIITTRMPEVIQKHMLEHADGSGPSGIIIQYNCDDYDCESDLVQKLTALVEEYPDNVYLAPNNYDGKIILTKLGRRAILDQFDEQAIRNFIR